MSKNASRKFTSAAKYLKNLIWNEMSKVDVSRYKSSVQGKVNAVPSLAQKAAKATVKYEKRPQL